MWRNARTHTAVQFLFFLQSLPFLFQLPGPPQHFVLSSQLSSLCMLIHELEALIPHANRDPSDDSAARLLLAKRHLSPMRCPAGCQDPSRRVAGGWFRGCGLGQNEANKPAPIKAEGPANTSTTCRWAVKRQFGKPNLSGLSGLENLRTFD